MEDAQQNEFYRACLSGDARELRRLLEAGGIDLDRPDDSGSPGLLLASCFGFADVVQLLLEAGADVNAHDSRGWSALVWATNNHHSSIAKLLLDSGASKAATTSLGRTAQDFCDDDELKRDLEVRTISGDFYDAGGAADMEESLREQERSNRMAAEAGMNLEIDLGVLSLEAPAEETEADAGGGEQPDSFVWDKCLPSQMFVFDEEAIADMIQFGVDSYPPKRSPAQKLVPANLFFLASRFAHYYGSQKLLDSLLDQFLGAVEAVLNRGADDMTTLSFWISNCLLLQYYLRKDPGLQQSSAGAQLRLSELVSEAYVLLVRDAERRIEKTLEESILAYAAIDGLAEIEMSDEWRIFRRRKQDANGGTVSPRRQRGPTPRNITSLLSSTEFILDAYQIHPLLVVQVLAQIVHWFSRECFNRIMANRKYLCRSKAMDLRMNVSQIEEWLRTNNRSWGTTPDLVTRTTKSLKPLVGILQLLQCISSLGEDEVRGVVSNLDGITARQARHVVEHYRAERTEPRMSKAIRLQLQALEREENGKDDIYLSATEQLTFSLPSSTDLIVSYGAGIGGVATDNERHFTPSLPNEIVEKLDGARGGLSAADRATAYALGVGGAGADEGPRDFEALEKEERENKVAELLGKDGGVW